MPADYWWVPLLGVGKITQPFDPSEAIANCIEQTLIGCPKITLEPFSDCQVLSIVSRWAAELGCQFIGSQ